MSKPFRATLLRTWGWGNPYQTHFIPPKERDTQRGFNNTSGYRGVWQSVHPPRIPRWRACISVEGKTIHLGTFLSAVDAARAYDAAAMRYHGADAVLNSAWLATDRRFGHDMAMIRAEAV